MGVTIRQKPQGSGIWWVFINHQGKRRSKKIGRDKRTALEVAKKIEAKLTLGEFGLDDESGRDILFGDYAMQWLEGYVANALKYSTYRGYKIALNRHILPVFRNCPVKSITRDEIKTLLFKKINQGSKLQTVRNIKTIVSGILTHAMEDGHIEFNPASRLGRLLTSKDESLHTEISPLTAEELEIYLDTCKQNYPDYYPMFLTLARTGMRLGEALGLQWGDIDFTGRFIEVRRAWVQRRVTTPKSGKTRRVDMTPQLAQTLKHLNTTRKEETLRQGRGELEDWVFINKEGVPKNAVNFRNRIHYRICDKAGLRRVRIHDLRHSYATIRISAGHNIADVSKQLGHASYKITVDTYYHWLPNEKKSEVEELDSLGKRAHLNAPYTHPEKNKELSKIAKPLKSLKAAPGFEPGNSGFADRRLTTWLCRRCFQTMKR